MLGCHMIFNFRYNGTGTTATEILPIKCTMKPLNNYQATWGPDPLEVQRTRSQIFSPRSGSPYTVTPDAAPVQPIHSILTTMTWEPVYPVGFEPVPPDPALRAFRDLGAVAVAASDDRSRTTDWSKTTCHATASTTAIPFAGYILPPSPPARCGDYGSSDYTTGLATRSELHVLLERLNDRYGPPLLPTPSATKYIPRVRRATAREERLLTQSAEYALTYARNYLHGRFPRGEPAISENCVYALAYAKDVVGGRWRLGEPAISADARTAVTYCQTILHSPWALAEPYIAADSGCSLDYAYHCLHDRFYAGENNILQDITGGTNPSKAAKAISNAVAYAQLVLKRPWPELERIVAANSEAVLLYLAFVVRPYAELAARDLDTIRGLIANYPDKLTTHDSAKILAIFSAYLVARPTILPAE